MPLLRRRRAVRPRSRRRVLTRFAALSAIGGIVAYRRQRLDAADRDFPQAVTRTP